MKNPNNRNYLFFDLGNVLFKFRETEFKQCLNDNRKICFSRDVFNEQYNKIISRSFVGGLSLEETWQKLFDLTDLDPQGRLSAATLYKVESNKKLINAIKADFADNFRLGIISDLHQIAFHSVVNIFSGFFSDFEDDLVFFSNLTKKTKKAHGLAYFKEIANRQPSGGKLVYIDDEDENIEKASAAGFHCIKYQKPVRSDAWEEANLMIIDRINSI